MSRIIYISGGQRSGKSVFAENLAKSISERPTYLATARCWDKEFSDRIQKHKNRRGDQWQNIEKEVNISSLMLPSQTVLMDCVTLWLTNIFLDNDSEKNKSLQIAKNEWDKFSCQDFTLIVVSNEIGMGVVPMDILSRAFVDLQGEMNQYIASRADEAYTIISGLPLKLK